MMPDEWFERLDELPERRGTAGIVRMERVEHRTRSSSTGACEKCGEHVGDVEYRATLTALGYQGDLDMALTLPRKCPRCIAEARKVNAWLNAECERLDRRDRDRAPTRPPLGLRFG
jgi:hypothetical protein